MNQNSRHILVIILQFTLCFGIVFSQGFWCKWVNYLDLDFCWIVQTNFEELKVGFPRYYLVVHLTNLVLDYGLPLAFLILLMFRFRKSIPQNQVLLVSSSVVTLILAELAFRMIGWVPGQFRYNHWVRPVEELIDVQGFVSDENGIFKIDTSVAYQLKEITETQGFSRKDVEKYFGGPTVSVGLMEIFEDHLEAIDSVGFELSQRINEIKKRLVLSGHDSVLIHYFSNPCNEDGFYSIPFEQTRSEKPKILLLGDSFTWGHSTSNKTLSFSNTLLSRDYVVYNTGISGADVAQYRKVLETYLKRLKPDLVIVNFYMGNDVSYFQRFPKAHLPILYATNAGNIYGFQDGIQFETKEDAYHNVMRNMKIPNTTKINRLMSKSMVSTLVWKGLVNFGLVEHDFMKLPQRPEIPYCNKDLKDMMNFCQENKTKFLLSVIPNLNHVELVGAESVAHLFDSIPYHQPNMTVDMYNKVDGHFNDKGHLVYANYLDRLIQELDLESNSLKN